MKVVSCAYALWLLLALPSKSIVAWQVPIIVNQGLASQSPKLLQGRAATRVTTALKVSRSSLDTNKLAGSTASMSTTSSTRGASTSATSLASAVPHDGSTIEGLQDITDHHQVHQQGGVGLASSVEDM